MNDQIIIRVMKESDLEQVLQLRKIVLNLKLENPITKEILINYLKRNCDLSSVACTLEGKVIGALLCGHDGIRGFIYHIVVYNEYGINHIRKMMIKRSLLELEKIGINTGFVLTQNSTCDMEDFWNSIGWIVIPDTEYFYNKI